MDPWNWNWNWDYWLIFKLVSLFLLVGLATGLMVGAMTGIDEKPEDGF